MGLEKDATTGRRTRRQILNVLKAEGPLGVAMLAARLGVTGMAVRQHLKALEAEGLATSHSRPVPVGRPAQVWELTREADRFFPEAYAELSVSLIDAMQEAFGADGFRRVLAARSERQEVDYRRNIPAAAPLASKLVELARIRTEEGYMAEVRADEQGFLLIEKHCPICAAATFCQGFCSLELDLFRAVLGPGVSVQRVDHIVSGDHRCAYRVVEESAVATQ